MTGGASETIGPFLRALRMARCLSLRQLAERAAVSRRTLLYWESGTYQPSLPELQAVLRAMEVSPEERLHSLTVLHAPRAQVIGRRVLTAPLNVNAPECLRAPGILPSGGDLLRSLRLRRGFRLEQVAAHLRVSPSTVSRWEASKTAPPDERLRELLQALGANAAETDALRQGYLFLQTPLREKAASLEDLRESFQAFADALYSQREDPLNDLRFLTFEAQAWRLAAHGGMSEAGERILADVRADYASYLSGFDRLVETGRYADSVLTVSRNMGDPLPKASQVRAAIIAARAAVYRGRRTGDRLPVEDSEDPTRNDADRANDAPQPAHPERGLALLQRWQTLALPPEFHAWLLSDMAEYLALQKDREAAVRLRREACEIAARCANPDELRLRQLDLAKLEVRLGAPDRALTRVELKPTDTPFRRADIELFFAEASLALAKPDAARAWFERGHADVETHRLLHLRRRARNIAARLAC